MLAKAKMKRIRKLLKILTNRGEKVLERFELSLDKTMH